MSHTRLLLAWLLTLSLGAVSHAAAQDREDIERHIAEAKRRAANSLLQSNLGEHIEFEYRDVHLTADDTRPNVCGEVREKNGDEWSTFIFVGDRDEIISEPHPDLDEATATWFQNSCLNAAIHIQSGRKGSADQIRSCHVAALFAEAKYERARFELAQYAYC